MKIAFSVLFQCEPQAYIESSCEKILRAVSDNTGSCFLLLAHNHETHNLNQARFVVSVWKTSPACMRLRDAAYPSIHFLDSKDRLSEIPVKGDANGKLAGRR